MASNTHVDSRVAERRLRPIYDWLDSGNNKKAVQEAEKVLKKQPNFLCAKVLKALALQRLGKKAESEEILENVCGQVPTDEATLQAITICYRAIQKPDKICEVYSAASRKDPSNEELLTHLFMSYVRIGDYKKQQQYAMNLYKLKPKNPYYFWAVMSVALQAKSEKNMSDSLALRLAEKMVSKFVSEGKIEAEQEVHLYLMILEMQGKYEEALDVMEGALGEKLKSMPGKRIELLMRLGRWKEANVLLKAQIRNNADSWSDCCNYLTTMLKLYEQHLDETQNSPDDYRVPLAHEGGECVVWEEADYLPSQAEVFFTLLAEEACGNGGARPRAPHLAKLELVRRLQLAGAGLGHPPLDMRPYLEMLSQDDASIVMRHVSDAVGIADGESPPSLWHMQQHISRLQLSRTLGFHDTLTIEEQLSFCQLLVTHYNVGQQFVEEDKLPTELSCNDPYILMASHVLYSVYLQTSDPSHLLTAIHHLEQALLKSPSNFHLKLLLIKFYLLLGAGDEAHHYVELLEMKHIQLDSMCYLATTSLHGLACFSHASALYDATLRFFISNTNDSVDHLTYAYKFGSFLKIDEFVEFRDRLNDSLHFTFCTVEKMLMDLLSSADMVQTEHTIASMDLRPNIDSIEWSRLRDNRDLAVIQSFEPKGGKLSPEVVAKSFEQLQDYVRVRVALLKCLVAALSLGASESEQVPGCSKTLLQHLVNDLHQLYTQLSSSPISFKESINSPPPCRLQSYLQIPMYKVVSCMITILVNVEECDKIETVCWESVTSLQQTMNAVTDAVLALLPTAKLSQRREVLETTVGAVEMLAAVVVLGGGAKRLSAQKKTKCGRRARRKKDNSDGGVDDKGMEVCTVVMEQVAGCLRRIHALLESVTDTCQLETLTLEDSNVGKKVQQSYHHALRELRNFIQERLHYIGQVLS